MSKLTAYTAFTTLLCLFTSGFFSYSAMADGDNQTETLPEITAIHLRNLKPNSIIQCPFLIVKGHLQTSRALTPFIERTGLWVEQAKRARAYSVQVTLSASNTRTVFYPASVYRDEFSALVELQEGTNTIRLQSGNAVLTFNITYRPMQTKRRVRFFYVTDTSGDTRYNSPFLYDKQNYLAKIDTVAKMLQTAVAEGTSRFGVGKRTFALELNAHGKVVVHTVRTNYTTRYLTQLQGFDYWDCLRKEVVKQHLLQDDVFVVIVAIEHPNAQPTTPNRKYLGGGQVAVVSSRGMFAWPTSAQEVIPTFYDSSPVDTEYRTEDSAHRGTIWGVASLSLGAMLHEMAHAFGLVHSANPQCTLNTGYADFHRFFVMDDAPSLQNALPIGRTLKEVNQCPIDHTKEILRIPWLYLVSVHTKK